MGRGPDILPGMDQAQRDFDNWTGRHISANPGAVAAVARALYDNDLLSEAVDMEGVDPLNYTDDAMTAIAACNSMLQA